MPTPPPATSPPAPSWSRWPLIGPAWSWLAKVPIDDPVDRRNAPVLQILSVLLAVLPALAWGYRVWLLPQIPWRPGELGTMLLSLTVCVAAAVTFALVRLGHFKAAARLLLAVFALTVIPSYATTGFEAQRFEQPVLAIWIVVAGLTLGRAALWSMFGCIVAAFAIGLNFDLSRFAGDTTGRGSDTLYSIAIFLMISLVVDRSSSALRESLREALARSDALARSNAALEAERSERERVQEQLIHAQKVEAVGRLASGVAHDFNHLLGLMLGHAARGRKTEDVAALKQALQGTESAARRAAAVARKLLDFSRQDASRPEPFDLRELLAGMQPMLVQLFDPSVRVEIDTGTDPQTVHFDRAQFELIVLNLAANANQAMPAGGHFRIGLPAMANSALVEVVLADTGTGMDEVVRLHCMEAFFTTKPSGQGTGLGLAVAAQLVRAAGGDIDVQSSPGQGSSFRIRLPRWAGVA